MTQDNDCWSLEEKKEMSGLLQQHIVNAGQPDKEFTSIEHLPRKPRSTLSEQMSFLSSISNFHWWDYIKVDGKSVGKRPKTSYSTHLLWCPDEAESVGGAPTLKYIPTSPRNRLMYFVLSGHADSLRDNIMKLIKSDRGLESLLPEKQPEMMPPEGGDVEQQPPPKKKRRQAVRLLRVDRDEMIWELGVDSTELSTEGKKKRQYLNYREQLITDGLIQWREHDGDQDVVVMSNYDSSNGRLLPSSYVHVTCMYGEREAYIKCTCSCYSMLQSTALTKVSLIPGEEPCLHDSLTCMHSRFFKECLIDSWTSIPEAAQGGKCTLIQQKILDSWENMYEDVNLLGNVVLNGATKFSVKGEDSFAIVNLTFRQGMCWARCTEGLCNAELEANKKIPRYLREEEKSKKKGCSHIKTLLANFDKLKTVFPEYFQELGEQEAESVPPAFDIPLENTEDVNLNKQPTGNFDVESGLWTFPAKSKHKPNSMTSPITIECVPAAISLALKIYLCYMSQ